MRSLVLLLVFLALIAASAWTIYFVNQRAVSDSTNQVSLQVESIATPTPTPVATATPVVTPSATPKTVVAAVAPQAKLPQAGVDTTVLVASAASLLMLVVAMVIGVRISVLRKSVLAAYRK